MGNEPKRKRRSDEDLRKISKHLIHELRMLQQTCELARMEDNAIKKNAYLSSFAVYARNLLDFFYAPAGPKTWPRPDDVIAEDFFDSPLKWRAERPAKSNTLQAVNRRVGKEVAHLTYERLLTMSKGNPWANSVITNEMRTIFLDFRSRVPSARLGDAVAKFFKSDT